MSVRWDTRKKIKRKEEKIRIFNNDTRFESKVVTFGISRAFIEQKPSIKWFSSVQQCSLLCSGFTTTTRETQHEVVLWNDLIDFYRWLYYILGSFERLELLTIVIRYETQYEHHFHAIWIAIALYNAISILLQFQCDEWCAIIKLNFPSHYHLIFCVMSMSFGRRMSCRTPVGNTWVCVSGIPGRKWAIIRQSNQFVTWVRGMPSEHWTWTPCQQCDMTHEHDCMTFKCLFVRDEHTLT